MVDILTGHKIFAKGVAAVVEVSAGVVDQLRHVLPEVRMLDHLAQPQDSLESLRKDDAGDEEWGTELVESAAGESARCNVGAAVGQIREYPRPELRRQLRWAGLTLTLV